MPESVTMGYDIAQGGLGEALRVGLWVMAAAILAVGGVYVARSVKRWARRDEGAEPFTLQQLRNMRAQDAISEREFADLRSALLARARSATDQPPPAVGSEDSGQSEQR
jgi:hypothetical protein